MPTSVECRYSTARCSTAREKGVFVSDEEASSRVAVDRTVASNQSASWSKSFWRLRWPVTGRQWGGCRAPAMPARRGTQRLAGWRVNGGRHLPRQSVLLLLLLLFPRRRPRQRRCVRRQCDYPCSFGDGRIAAKTNNKQRIACVPIGPRKTGAPSLPIFFSAATNRTARRIRPMSLRNNVSAAAAAVAQAGGIAA